MMMTLISTSLKILKQLERTPVESHSLICPSSCTHKFCLIMCLYNADPSTYALEYIPSHLLKDITAAICPSR